MQIDKSLILDYLRQHSSDEIVAQAKDELPDTVDTAEHTALVEKYDLKPQHIFEQMSGGGGLGNLPGT